MSSTGLKERIDAAVEAVRGRSSVRPRVGITLGTGLGGLVEEMEIDCRIPYAEIPGFPHPRVTSHEGTLILGALAGCPAAVLEGRYHVYEGYSLEEITLPVRVLSALGVELAIFSNAAGGLHPQFERGDIMLIADHINLMGVNPLIGPNDDRLGPRFPDMSQPYHRETTARLETLALDLGIRTRRGVYAALTGPCLETPAEYRFLRLIGADAVGMSTVPEVIVAAHCGLRSIGLSCITDICLPDALEPVKIQEILRVAAEAEPKMRCLVTALVSSL
jgi:purine-nucleoside phosphorylase